MSSDDSRAADWSFVPLKSLVDRRGISYGVVQPGRPWPDGVPLVRVNNITKRGLRLRDVMRIEPAIAERYARSSLRGGEVLVTLVGSVGNVAVAPPELAGWNIARAVGIIPVREGISAKWIEWCLQAPAAQRYFQARVNTTVQKTLNLRDLANLEVPLPPPDQIAAVSSVMGALDEKIASNRRLATLLEDTAAALFAARFVDFVGVEELVETEAGPIPREWTFGSLADIARFVNGKAFTKLANEAGRPIIRIRELNSGIDSDTPRSDIEAAEEFVAQFGDILFAWSGSLDVYRWGGDAALINQHIFKVIPDGFPPWFVYGWIRQHMPSFQASARDRAVTMGHIRRHHLDDAGVPLPTRDAVAGAAVILDPLDEKARALTAETATLIEIRDALLPKLISGGIRFSNTADPAEVIEAGKVPG